MVGRVVELGVHALAAARTRGNSSHRLVFIVATAVLPLPWRDSRRGHSHNRRTPAVPEKWSAVAPAPALQASMCTTLLNKCVVF
ncbi:hypothetical protein BJI47_02045 [Rhodococcus sp. 1168]|nr:hypothetical protein BJI47_02045 [Rhodococcus sp. 1168]